jgi:hypothetical protein
MFASISAVTMHTTLLLTLSMLRPRLDPTVETTALVAFAWTTAIAATVCWLVVRFARAW